MNEHAYSFRAFADEQYPHHYGDMRPNGMGIVGALNGNTRLPDHVTIALANYEPTALDRSNFAVILEDLESIDDRVTTVYLHGCDWILIPLVGPVVDAAAGWMDALASYPAADDEHLSAIETEDMRETLQNCYDLSGDAVAMVARWLADFRSVDRAEELTIALVDEARSNVFADMLDALGLSDEQRQEYGREMLSDEDDRHATMIVSRRPYDPACGVALRSVVGPLRDRGLAVDAATTDEDGRVVLVLDWTDARSLAS